MSKFNCLEALETMTKSGHDLPFIIVSASTDEEITARTMRVQVGKSFLLDGKDMGHDAIKN